MYLSVVQDVFVVITPCTVTSNQCVDAFESLEPRPMWSPFIYMNVRETCDISHNTDGQRQGRLPSRSNVALLRCGWLDRPQGRRGCA